MPPSTDLWDVSGAAGAAASFAGLLAAIVLVVNAQLAQRGGVHRPLSHLIAPIGLLVLLIAAYEFILLSGEPSYRDLAAATAQQEAREARATGATRGNPAETEAAELAAQKGVVLVAQIESEVLKTGPLFAIAGSLLALGAVLAVAIIVVAVGETEGHSLSVTENLFYVTLAVAAIFLLFGYDDVRASQNARGGILWWTLHMAAIAFPITSRAIIDLGGRLVHRPAERSSPPLTLTVGKWAKTLSLHPLAEANDNDTRIRPAQRSCLILGLVAIFIVPTMSYLLVSNDMLSIPTNVLTLAAAVWFGLGATLLVNTLATFDPGHSGPSGS